MTLDESLKRIEELERRVRALEARPAQQVHYHYTQPPMLGQPHWPPGTILCSSDFPAGVLGSEPD